MAQKKKVNTYEAANLDCKSVEVYFGEIQGGATMDLWVTAPSSSKTKDFSSIFFLVDFASGENQCCPRYCGLELSTQYNGWDIYTNDGSGLSDGSLTLAPTSIPTSTPIEEETGYSYVSTNTKCCWQCDPNGYQQRPGVGKVFSTTPMTTDYCYSVCASEPECEYFSLGYANAGWNCILCNSEPTTNHNGFTTYEMIDDVNSEYFTGNTKTYDVIFPLSGSTAAVTFSVKASNDAHVGFFTNSEDLNSMYECVISGWANTKSVIRRSNQGTNQVTVATSGYLSGAEYHDFWCDVINGLVRCGTGNDIGSNIFMQWQDSSPLVISKLGLMTGWGATGDWKIYSTGRRNLNQRKSVSEPMNRLLAIQDN